MTNFKKQVTIKGDCFDQFILSRSEYKNLSSCSFWNEDSQSVIISPSYYTEQKREVFLTPYMTVRLKKEEDIDILNSYVEQYKLRIVRNSQLMPLWYVLSLTIDSEKGPLECANKLWESGKFAASAPDLASDDIRCSNDPNYVDQWGLSNSYCAGIDISAYSAWGYATGEKVKIGIIDEGVDTTHVDLSPNCAHMSYDTETGTSQSVLYDYHGTHCAGIAAAVKDNGIYIAGVAPDATIISISNSLQWSNVLPLQLAEGITWAYLHGVEVISNSWHLPQHDYVMDEAIDNAFKYGRQGKGCVIVFAAGNHDDDVNWNTNVSYPANCNDTILVVGAIDSSGERAEFSNYGAELDLVAPGVDIISTLPNDSVGYLSGTSMACPHVAGVAALILERNPELTVTQVNHIICSNAKKISGVNFNVTKPEGSWNNEYGYGLVDAYYSLLDTPKIEYIQNDTITGERTISAEKIYVGRDVTDRKEYGDVLLGSGYGDDIWLNSKHVTIKNSTRVPLGTTFYIGSEDETTE